MAFPGLPRIDLRDRSSHAHAHWNARCRRSAGLDGSADEAAAKIVRDVRARGDAAVCEAVARFEGRSLTPDQLEVSAQRVQSAQSRTPAAVRAAMELAAERIRGFHRAQRMEATGTSGDGWSLQSRVAPLTRVAVYAPGGTAAYPSSVLMAAIPAKVAGVRELILLTPRASDVVLHAAELAAVDRVFEVGGAQAIAAAAFGTSTIPRVDKIVGPGNAYVTAAKRHVFGVCDIDGVAGPSEILIMADQHADPALVAADLISQAEHDPLACAVLLTDAPQLPDAVDRELHAQLGDLPRRDIAHKALVDHGAAVLLRHTAAMIEAANAYAPEHLELLVQGADAIAPALTTAGAIFVGSWTPEAAGDYTAGPSHVLPTAGAARFASPLGVWDFVKHTSVLHLDEASLRGQAAAIVELARAEGLEGHARAVERRLAPGNETGIKADIKAPRA